MNAISTSTMSLSLLVAALLCGCAVAQFSSCPDFAGSSQSACGALLPLNNSYIADVSGVHYYAAYSAAAASRQCAYLDFEPATGNDCLGKLFGYLFVVFYNSTTKAYLPTIKANWVQRDLGRARSRIESFPAGTADDVILAQTAGGFVWARCAPFGTPGAPAVAAILTVDRMPKKAVVDELEQLAKAAGFTGTFNRVAQVPNCPDATPHQGPAVTLL